MTIVMQSSSAAAAATLVALHAGSLSFLQACAMVVGQSIGTAATSAALGATSGGRAVRRSALAHIIFSVVVGVLGMLFLSPLASAATWAVSGLDDYDGVLAVAAFSSLFKLMGVVVFFPWLDAYSRFIVNLSGKGDELAVSRLEPALAQAGGPVALEAGRRALLEVSRAPWTPWLGGWLANRSSINWTKNLAGRSTISSSCCRWKRSIPPTWSRAWFVFATRSTTSSGYRKTWANPPTVPATPTPAAAAGAQA